MRKGIITDHEDPIGIPEFDAIETYEKEIAPKLDEVIALLRKHGLPFLGVVITKRTEDTLDSEIRALFPGARTPEPLRALAYLSEKFGDPNLASTFGMLARIGRMEDCQTAMGSDEQAESRELVDQ